MKAKHLLLTLGLSLLTLFAFAQFPGNNPNHGNQGYDPEQRDIRGHHPYDDDDEGYRRGNGQTIQLALLLDASGSMNGLIDQAKAQLWNIVNGLSWDYDHRRPPRIEIAVYEYGQATNSHRNGFIRQVVPFTQDFDWVSEGLYTIYTGGNREYVGQVIRQATRQLRWSRRPSAIKMIYVAGNEHIDQGFVDYRDAIYEANRQGISVSTIFCGPYREGIHKGWQHAAQIGQGEYANIDHNFRHRRHDYDDPYFMRLNTRLNDTYLPYGTYGQRNYLRLQEQDRNAARYGNSNLAQRALTKASPSYQASNWDLIDAVTYGKVDLARVPDPQLPANMRGMSLDQKQQFVARKKAEREQITSELRQLAKRQQQKSQVKPAPGAGKQITLDQAIISSTKKQMQKGGNVTALPPSKYKKPVPEMRTPPQPQKTQPIPSRPSRPTYERPSQSQPVPNYRKPSSKVQPREVPPPSKRPSYQPKPSRTHTTPTYRKPVTQPQKPVNKEEVRSQESKENFRKPGTTYQIYKRKN
jgi:hypothetical protein